MCKVFFEITYLVMLSRWFESLIIRMAGLHQICLYVLVWTSFFSMAHLSTMETIPIKPSCRRLIILIRNTTIKSIRSYIWTLTIVLCASKPPTRMSSVSTVCHPLLSSLKILLPGMYATSSLYVPTPPLRMILKP